MVAAVGLRLRICSVKVTQKTAVCWLERRPNQRTRSHYTTVARCHGFQSFCLPPSLYLRLSPSFSCVLSLSLPPYSLSPFPLSVSVFLPLCLSRRASASEFSRLVLVLEGAEGELHLRRSRRPARWVVSAYCTGSGSPVTVHGVCRLRVAGDWVRIAGYGSPVSGFRFRVSGYGTPITGRRVRVPRTCDGLRVTGYE